MSLIYVIVTLLLLLILALGVGVAIALSTVSSGTPGPEREDFEVDISSVPGKTIWLLWLQGWDSNIPYVVQRVQESWRLLNPGWNIELVSMSNLHTYISIPGYLDRIHGDAAKSDVIRLHLLKAHGGVWADATVLCMIPLDRWVFPAMQPAGFWMYHGRDYGKGPASWFLMSLRGAEIARKWAGAADAFWTRTIADGDGDNFDYYWMDALFADLCSTDTSFARSWGKVPYLWADSTGQSHMLAGKCFQEDPALIKILRYNPPYAVKLSRHGWDQAVTPTCNAMMAIKYALAQENAPYPLHDMVFRTPDQFSDSVMVVADCNAPVEYIHELSTLCAENNDQLIIYDKCNFCKLLPHGIYCRPLPNVGRETGTFLFFVVNYYDSLPSRITLTPSNIKKWNRMSRIRDMYEHKNHGCIKGSPDKDFTIDEWDGQRLEPANIRPFGEWHNMYIGPQQPDHVCWNGLMRTTRDRILQRPKDFYVNLLYEVDKTTDPSEIGHYIERSLYSIFHA